MAPQNSTFIHANGNVATTAAAAAAAAALELSQCFEPLSPLNDGKIENSSKCGRNGCATTSTPTSHIRGSNKWNKQSIYCRAINYKTQEEPENDGDEIPIWICGEPRYISGITELTTCQDLIQALIDDEISTSASNVAASRDVNDYMITERWRDVEQALPADTRILPIWNAWDSARDEVKFRLKINKYSSTSSSSSSSSSSSTKHEVNLNGNNSKREKLHFLMKILRKLLKQRHSIDCELIESKKRNFDDSFDVAMDNLFRATTTTHDYFHAKNKLGTKSNFQTKLVHNSQQIGIPVEDDDDDELLLVIENNCDDGDSGVHVEGRTLHQPNSQHTLTSNIIHTNKNNSPLSYHATQFFGNNFNPNPNNDDGKLMISCKLSNSSSSKNNVKNSNNNNINNLFTSNDVLHVLEPKYIPTSTTKRKVSPTNFGNDLWHKHKYNRSNRHSKRINANNKESTKITRFDFIQNEIFLKIHDIRMLLEREQYLTDMIEHKCAQYKAQNELYMSKLGLDICIERVQENLEIYTREIIQNEQELLNVKIEILDKSKKLEHLKQIRDLERPKCLKDRAKTVVPRELVYDEDDGEIVDSLTGVFDKNDSVIV